jgi:hypothetical protein
VAAGGAVVALGLAVHETAIWSEKTNDFDDHVGPLASRPGVMGLNCGADDPGHGGPGCQEIHDQMSRARTLAIVGFAAGGVLAATSIVLLTTSSIPVESSSRVAVECRAGLPMAGLSCRGVF